MRRMPIQAGEYSVIKTYLDLLVSLPWAQSTSDKLDIGYARQVLDHDHYGLQEIKERILEFLAVRKLRAERRPRSSAEDDCARSDPPRTRRRCALFRRPARRGQDQPGHQHRTGPRPANSSA
jgi:ATP-dependent Lon protease